MPFSYSSDFVEHRVPSRNGLGPAFFGQSTLEGGTRMKSIGYVGAALLALGIGTGTAAALPQAPVTEGDGLVTRVQVDCHRDVRRHYLPEYGRRVWHRHRQSNCRVILADPDFDDLPRDCHR